jgi:iron complex outermembrane receptor protein
MPEMRKKLFTQGEFLHQTLLLFCICYCLPVSAEQDFMAGIEEDVLFADIPSVFGASKYEQKVTEAPSRISIVTGAEIRRFGYRTLSEVFASLPGFSVNNDRNYLYTGVRGFGIPGDYDARLLQLVNGHRVNDNIYGSLFNDHSLPVDMQLIERIEVIRGPSSSLYGSSAFFAVVNIVTKEGRDVGGLEVSGAAGSFATEQAQVTYGDKSSNGVEYLVSVSVADTDGDDRLYYREFDDPLTNNGVAEDVDAEKYQKFFTRVSFGDLAFEAAYSERDKDIPTGSYGTVFNSQQNTTTDSRGYLDVSFQKLLANGSDLTSRVYYDKYSYDGDYLYDYGIPGDPYLSLNKDSADGESWGAEFQWNAQLGRHRMVLGADYRDSFREDQKNYDQDDAYLNSDTESESWALFIQDEIRLHDKLLLSMGVRYDNYDNFGDTVNPRAALIWSVQERTVVKLLYGEAFRAPNAYEVYYNDSSLTWKPSVDLEPETIKSTELVFEQQFGSSLRGVLSVYDNEIENLIATVSDPADDLLVFVNQGDVQAQGLEMELENKWDNNVSASASYSYQEAENQVTGNKLTNYPTHMVKSNITAPLLGDYLGAAVELQYDGGRRTIAGNKTGSRTLANLGLYSESWIDGLKIVLNVYNLFDKEYGYPGSEEHLQDIIEQDGRTFRLRLDYAF